MSRIDRNIERILRDNPHMTRAEAVLAAQASFKLKVGLQMADNSAAVAKLKKIKGKQGSKGGQWIISGGKVSPR